MSPVDEQICELKMTSLTEKIGLMLKPITDGIQAIKDDMKSIKEGAEEYVRRSEFEAKCKDIEELKKFVWKVSGGLAVISFLIGIAVKFIK